jgi:hypothetical protein
VENQRDLAAQKHGYYGYFSVKNQTPQKYGYFSVKNQRDLKHGYFSCSVLSFLYALQSCVQFQPSC